MKGLKGYSWSLLGAIIAVGLFLSKGITMESQIKLPLPKKTGEVSVEEVLSKRRSVREYQDEALSQEEVSQLLWAAGGITTSWGARTAPSGGALYPLEIFLVVGKVTGWEAGIYHYQPQGHLLVQKIEGDKRLALCHASLGQSAIKNAPLSLVICAEYPRITRKYGERGRQYALIEVGHIGQNIYLQAQTLGLVTVAIGAFNDTAVQRVLGIKEEPLYIMPVGRPK